MSTTAHTRLNLVVDDKLKEILAYFHAKYPLLKDADLIKMAVSGFYANQINNLPVDEFYEYQNQSLADSIKSKTFNQSAFNNVSELVDYLEN